MADQGMEPRDYNRANSGGRFNDESGDFSVSPERDHDWSVRPVAPATDESGGAEFFSSVAAGMAVVGADADEIGTVKEIDALAFLVDRSLQRDVWVPFVAVQAVDDGRVVLTVPADSVADMGWENPPLGVGPDEDKTGTEDIVI